ncbi:MAG TPA: BrnT family toxin, partial [Ktedonobacterales bacterium]|nr:BrnT family toxin [Ktedonobacterales bacterium]
WDEAKALTNLRKHGVSFEEAQSVFDDPDSITIFDEGSSDDEDRFVDIGLSEAGHILVVVYTEREERIR